MWNGWGVGPRREERREKNGGRLKQEPMTEIEPDPVLANHPIGSIVEVDVGLDGFAAATFDENHDYRYRLSRVWDDTLPRVVWCMLNPSTASAFRSDPTVSRVISFSRRWGYGAAEVVNLFALRSSFPSKLVLSADPVGSANDAAVSDAVAAADLVIAAWGNHGSLVNPKTGIPRSKEVLDLLDRCEVQVHRLYMTKELQPGHPLYIRSDTVPIVWTRPFSTMWPHVGGADRWRVPIARPSRVRRRLR
jgi:hypothetical protein